MNNAEDAEDTEGFNQDKLLRYSGSQNRTELGLPHLDYTSRVKEVELEVLCVLSVLCVVI